MPRLFLFLAALAFAATGAHAQSLTAYPNPYAGGPFTVVTDEANAVFELVDLLGRQLDPRQTLAPGAYLWRLRYADGSASSARPLTLTGSGPLHVRLVHEAGLARLAVPTEPSPTGTASAKAATCALAPGGVVFGGAYHAPTSGAVLSGGTTMRVQRAEGAAFQTCVPGLPGVGLAFPAGQSPFTDSDTELRLEFSGTMGGGAASGAFLLERDDSGTSATISGGFAPSVDRLAEVIRFDADGQPVVVASATIPAGVPLSEPWVSASLVIDFQLMGTATVGREGSVEKRGAPGGTVGTLFSFRAGAPLSFQLPGQPAVEGDAVALTAAIDGVLALDAVSMDASASVFEVDALGFVAYGAETSLFSAAPPADQAPAWVQMQTPEGLFATGPNTGLRLACGDGEACTEYAAEVSPRFATWGSSSSTLAPASLLSPPTAAEIHGGPFERAPGRGLLTARHDRFRTTLDYYVITLERAAPTPPVQRTASVSFGKPRLNKTTLRMEEECADELAATPCEPSFTQFELRYIQDGTVRLRKTLPAGRDVTVKARLEILDALATSDANGPVLRYAVSYRGGEEFVEFAPIVDAPTGSEFVYGKITWTYSEPWTLGFASTASGSPASVTAPPAASTRETEAWAFEVE